LSRVNSQNCAKTLFIDKQDTRFFEVGRAWVNSDASVLLTPTASWRRTPERPLSSY
jgi:hypothetical protein